MTSIIGTEICGSSSRGVARMREQPDGQRRERDQRRELRAQKRLRDPSGDAHDHFLRRDRGCATSAARRRDHRRAAPPSPRPSSPHRCAEPHPATVVALRRAQRDAGEIALARRSPPRHDERAARAPWAREHRRAPREQRPIAVRHERVDRVEVARRRRHDAFDRARARACPRSSL